MSDVNWRYFVLTTDKAKEANHIAEKSNSERQKAAELAESIAGEHNLGEPRFDINKGVLAGFIVPADTDQRTIVSVGRDENGSTVFRPKWNTTLGKKVRKSFNASKWTPALKAVLQELFPAAARKSIIGGPRERGQAIYFASAGKVGSKWMLVVPSSLDGDEKPYNPEDGLVEISEADYLELKAAALRSEEAA